MDREAATTEAPNPWEPSIPDSRPIVASGKHNGFTHFPEDRNCKVCGGTTSARGLGALSSKLEKTHPKTISSKTISSKTEDNFIHDTFIQKWFHMTLSSKPVKSNDTSIQNHLHPKPKTPKPWPVMLRSKPTLAKPTLAKPTLANVEVFIVCKDFGFSEFFVWVF